MPEAGLDPHVEDQIAFLVGHPLGQAEARDLCAHHAARLRVAVKQYAFVSERHQIASDRQRGGAGADERDPLAVLGARDLRQIGCDVAAIVGGDAFQAADRDRLGFDPAAPAGGLARAIAGAPENAREDVRPPVDHERVGVAARCDEPDVFGNRGMGRARPLAIDDFVEVVRNCDVGGLQQASPPGSGATRSGLMPFFLVRLALLRAIPLLSRTSPENRRRTEVAPPYTRIGIAGHPSSRSTGCSMIRDRATWARRPMPCRPKASPPPARLRSLPPLSRGGKPLVPRRFPLDGDPRWGRVARSAREGEAATSRMSC